MLVLYSCIMPPGSWDFALVLLQDPAAVTGFTELSEAFSVKQRTDLDLMLSNLPCV